MQRLVNPEKPMPEDAKAGARMKFDNNKQADDFLYESGATEHSRTETQDGKILLFFGF